jgi:RNA polymerase sigma factor (sigma-70 family)
MQEQQAEFNRILRQEQKNLILYVKSRMKDISAMDAEDIVADAAFNIYNRLSTDQPIENLLAYFYQTVKNRMKDYFRRSRPAISFDELTDKEIASDFIDPSLSAQEEIELQETLAKIKMALFALEPKQRAIWIATELHHYSFKELATAWREPIGTLLSRKSRATQALRKALSNLHEE